MQVSCVFNGTTKIVLVPENEAEKLALKDLTSGEAKIISAEKMVLLDKAISDGIVIEKINNS